MENNLVEVYIKLTETLDIFQMEAVSNVSILEQWENVERAYDTVQDSLVERERKIEEKERFLKEIRVREKEIDERDAVLEEREKEIDVLEKRETEIYKKCVVLEEREKEIEERSVVLEERETEIEERSVVLEEREKDIDERGVVLEKQIDKKSVSLEETRKELDKRSVVLEETRKEFEERSVVLEEREKEIDMRSLVLEERETEIDKRSLVLEERETKIDKRSLVLEKREKEIGEKSVVLEVVEEEINKKALVLEEREWQILRNEEITKNLQLTHKKLIEEQRLSNLKERKLIEGCKEMELTKERINKEWESLKVRVGVKFEETETSEPSESPIDQLFRNMDLNGVLSYVIENENELNVCRETVLDYLRLAPTPAKLVLEVTQLCNNHGLSGKIGCINLLVGLMKLEEKISVSVRKEAEIFAPNLGSSVVKQDCSPLDVLCFLQFVVSFKLYDSDEILMFLQAFWIGRDVCWPDENTKLFVSALVQSLISREKHLEAAIYICAFKLEDTFSLEPLLDSHFKTIRKTAQETVSEASSSSAHQDDAANTELTALTNMMKVVSYFKLEPNCSTDSIGLRIAQLEKELRKTKVMAKVSTVKIEM